MYRIRTSMTGLLLLTTFSGCCGIDTHASLHHIAKQKCRHIINTEERMECEARHHETYREYKAKTYNAEESR